MKKYRLGFSQLFRQCLKLMLCAFCFSISSIVPVSLAASNEPKPNTANSIPVPLQSRMVEWVHAGTFEFPVDQSPRWLYSKKWQIGDDSSTFVAETPAQYYPPATFNAQHFIKQTVPDNQRDAKFFFHGVIESVAKNYGYRKKYIKGIQPSQKGDLNGYRVTVAGNINGFAQDVIIFAAATPENNVLVLTAFTEPDKAAHLQNTFDRIALNIKFIEADLQQY